MQLTDRYYLAGIIDRGLVEQQVLFRTAMEEQVMKKEMGTIKTTRRAAHSSSDHADTWDVITR